MDGLGRKTLSEIEQLIKRNLLGMAHLVIIPEHEEYIVIGKKTLKEIESFPDINTAKGYRRITEDQLNGR